MRFRTIAVITVSLAAMLAVAPSAEAATAKPLSEVCDVDNTYHITSYALNQLAQVGPTVALVNHGTQKNPLTYSTTFSGSIGVSLSGTITAEESVIIASAKESVSASATSTLTLTVGVIGVVNVRPGKVGTLQFGVFRIKTIGRYTHIDRNCRTTTGTVTGYTPYRIGYVAAGG